MSDIPRARELLTTLAKHPYLPEPLREDVTEILTLLDRRPTLRRSPRHKTKITDSIRAQILFLANNTELSQGAIASLVGLGPQAYGRVSEVLHKLR
jgi:hypothetical protein